MTAPNDPSPKPRWSKRTLFLMILAIAAGIAGVVSLVAYTIVDRTTEGELRFAVIAPLTGPRQAIGQAIRNGAELYASQVNGSGGVFGHKITLLAFDDGDDPERARIVAQQAVDAGVIGVVGHWSGAAAAAAEEVYRSRGLPALTFAPESGSGLSAAVASATQASADKTSATQAPAIQAPADKTSAVQTANAPTSSSNAQTVQSQTVSSQTAAPTGAAPVTAQPTSAVSQQQQPAVVQPAAQSAIVQSATESPSPWLFRNSYDQTFEIRFLANYIRNVLGEKMVSVLHEAGPDGEAQVRVFDEVLQRFGTKVVYRWSYDPSDPALSDRFRVVAEEIKNNRIVGAVVALSDPISGGKAVAALRAAGIRNRIAGPRSFAGAAFIETMGAEWKGKGSLASAINGVLVTTPLLFDTAGEAAQSFRNAFVKAHRLQPDWIAASGFDGLRLIAYPMFRIFRAHREMIPVEVLRPRIQQILRAHNGHDETQADGVFGRVAFDSRGVSTPTTMVGTYDGNDLIAAMTQLSPIREENVGNYLDEIVAGRALYVNDRFMYKTNVVYAGIKLDKLSGLDLSAGVASLDLLIWFRWRGGLEPQDVVFVNAAEPIKLDKPDREVRNGDMIYRSYRARGRFFLNYSNAERAYGTHIVGLAFHHRTLARNNLMYVGDTLGMDLNADLTLAEQMASGHFMDNVSDEGGETSFLKKLSGYVSPGGGGDPLVQAMIQTRVLAGLSGWVLDRAWLSQDVVRRGPEGDPVYVGFGKPQPEFSQLDLGSVLKPDQFDVHNVIPSRYFLAIAIFALVGALTAAALDRKERGQFWRMQTLCLRIITWPLLLLAGGALALDYSIQNLSTSTADTLVLIINSMWWLVPGRLMVISMERFVWAPLEIKTGRAIPNVIRMIVALIIYLFAIFGVIAFVMGKTVTSLLATSGLMAMIIGLAVQANIANIFSGIVLNLERPFSVGDYIKLGGSSGSTAGKIVDITWRTTRMRSFDGSLVCLANAKVSELEIHNFSRAAFHEVKTPVYVDPKHPPGQVLEIIRSCLIDIPLVAGLDEGWSRPLAVFSGIEWQNGAWSAKYMIHFQIQPINMSRGPISAIWERMWPKMQAAGIDWKNPLPTELPG
ncbi:Peripla_BP_6 domain-containing protein [Azospirillaceae bacterium]